MNTCLIKHVIAPACYNILKVGKKTNGYQLKREIVQ